MKPNPEKCLLLVMEDCQKKIKIGNRITQNSKYKELSGIEAVSKLNVKAHVEDLRKKASRKIHTLAKITP